MNRPTPEESAVVERRVRQVELIISNLLRLGVATSLALVITGVVLVFMHHPGYFSSPDDLQRLTQPGAAFPHTWSGVMAGIADFRGQAIIMAGLLVLIATPILRVAVSILAFLHQNDRTFAFITLAVLCLLILSFLLGKSG
jgi:uncharacterized membrane protein